MTEETRSALDRRNALEAYQRVLENPPGPLSKEEEGLCAEFEDGMRRRDAAGEFDNLGGYANAHEMHWLLFGDTGTPPIKP